MPAGTKRVPPGTWPSTSTRPPSCSPTSADDVAARVRAAAAAGLRVCVQGTGHNASAYGPLGDSLLIKTERMREVADRSRRRDGPGRRRRDLG